MQVCMLLQDRSFWQAIRNIYKHQITCKPFCTYRNQSGTRAGMQVCDTAQSYNQSICKKTIRKREAQGNCHE